MEQGKNKNSCTIKIQNFEGPLDLLYHLIEKNKMSIYDIKIEEITDQYMEHMYIMKKLDMEIASEFLVMAATLLHIKSRLLLPVDKKENKDGEEGIDPKEELLLRLLQYKKYKEFSNILREQEDYWGNTLFKGPESIEFVFEEEDLNISPEKLKELYIRLIRHNRLKRNERSKEDMVKIIQYEKVSLKSKIREVVRALIDKVSVKFSDLFLKGGQTKLEVVTGFLAILELAKLRKVELIQREVFADIEIKRKNVSEDFIADLPDEEQNIS